MIRIEIMPVITVSSSIPYACQFASPEHVWEFINKTRDLKTDPRWAEYGAASPDEYAHWAMRSCGVVCVKMAVEGLAGITRRPVMDWVREGLAIHGYLTEMRADRPVETGWKHSALAELARRHGLEGKLAAHLDVDDMAAHLRADRLIIVSVTSELGEDAPITRRSGHLVVVYGAEIDVQGNTHRVIAHNPSGRRPELRAGANIPVERFVEGFSGRGIVIY